MQRSNGQTQFLLLGAQRLVKGGGSYYLTLRSSRERNRYFSASFTLKPHLGYSLVQPKLP